MNALSIKGKIENLTNSINRVLSVDASNLTDAIQILLSTRDIAEEEHYYAYYLEYDTEKASYSRTLIQQIHEGDVLTLKEGEDVDEDNVGTSSYNPYLIFQEWSCALGIQDNTITIPSFIASDVYVGAIYMPSGGTSVFVDNYGVVINEKPTEGFLY